MMVNRLLKHAVAVVVYGLMFTGIMSVRADSDFRDEDFHPTLGQRSGLALLRIVGSPLAMFTEGVQYFNENKEATGRYSVLHFVGGMCVQGSVVTCLEAAGGCLELITFQQFKSFAYPWEIDENDPDMVRIIRENRAEEESASKSAGSVQGSSTISHKPAAVRKRNSVVHSSGSETRVRQRVQHSSCRGTGRCHICRGNGYVGSIRTTQDQTRLRCRGCGGSGSCRACSGRGYVD